jgi:hypothetical protein
MIAEHLTQEKTMRMKIETHQKLIHVKYEYKYEVQRGNIKK